jgi:hypothetical protein
MIDGSNLSATNGIKNLLLLKEEKAICTCIYAYNLWSSSCIYGYRSYCVNRCYLHSLGLPPSTVAPTSTLVSSTVALRIVASISTVASSTVAPMIP